MTENDALLIKKAVTSGILEAMNIALLTFESGAEEPGDAKSMENLRLALFERRRQFRNEPPQW